VKPTAKAFEAALTQVLESLAQQIARDGEGARKLVTIDVEGAASEKAAEQIARAIANSPLVKTAIAGSDPNWGRVLCAAGYAGIHIFEIIEGYKLNKIASFKSGIFEATPTAYQGKIYIASKGGFLYCFLADVNHQPINRHLDEQSYERCVRLMKHTGQVSNKYNTYLRWGSLASPWRTIAGVVLNWGFWLTVFYLIGGPGLACALFGAAGVWAVGVRTFNYEGHGKGKDKRQDNIDFNRKDMSINQLWPGIVAGEWHNNHHLYPGSARSGFLRYQIDFAWYFIKFLSVIGAVSSYTDNKKQFLQKYRHAGPLPVPKREQHLQY